MKKICSAKRLRLIPYTFVESKKKSRIFGKEVQRLVYRTSGVIFFIDYCTAIRDT